MTFNLYCISCIHSSPGFMGCCSYIIYSIHNIGKLIISINICLDRINFITVIALR